MTVGIILSAGESKRMGTPKQLLPWGKTIILQQVIDNAAASHLEQIILVLGCRAGEIANQITLSPKTRTVINNDYQEGMSSSVKCGVKNAPAGVEAYSCCWATSLSSARRLSTGCWTHIKKASLALLSRFTTANAGIP